MLKVNDNLLHLMIDFNEMVLLIVGKKVQVITYFSRISNISSLSETANLSNKCCSLEFIYVQTQNSYRHKGVKRNHGVSGLNT